MKEKSNLFSRLTNTKLNPPTYKVSVPEKMVRNAKANVENSPVKFRKLINGTPTITEGIIKPFDSIDTNYLKKLIREYEQLDITTLSDEEVKQKVGAIIPEMVLQVAHIKPGTEIYRARRCDYVGKGTGYYRNSGDVWCAPKHLIQWGRLNEPGEQVFYTSFDAITPMYEIRCTTGDAFALMKYEIKQNSILKVAYIAVGKFKNFYPNSDHIWTSKGRENWQLVHDFIDKEFGKLIDQGDSKAYRTTVAISKLYDFPGCDGFFYPSVLNDMSFNLAIKEDSVHKLEFAGLTYCKYVGRSTDPRRAGMDYDFAMYRRWAKSIDTNGQIDYEPVSNCEITFSGFGQLGEVSYDL